jgi:hypothetical protein
MEYQRKFRWANYETPKCKEYLRNDFSHECAYCKLQEKEVGLIDANYFEIDHFRPQSDDDQAFNPHLYSNLYYACEKCNGEKSDTWSEALLDPCKEDVFSGVCPPIIGGYNADTLYKYIAQDDRASYYIDTFKLNSRHHIRIRKRRINRQNNIHQIDALMDEILHKFDSKKNLANLDQLIKQLDHLRLSKKEELSNLSKDEKFESVEEYLTLRDIKNSIVFEEYNMDIKIKIEEISYYCELVVDNSDTDNEVKLKFLDTEKLTIWFEKLRCQFGILYYYSKQDKLYFYPISKLINKSDIAEFGSRKQIKLTEENMIT